MTLFEAIILTIITASTPLLIAAIGELVVERAGVLNLGVEGMMVIGAAAGIAAAIATGSSTLGVLVAVLAGMALSLVFAALVLGLAANQVAAGLACAGIGKIEVPLLSDIPFIGSVLFHQDPFVYASIALVVAVWWFLTKSRAGLVLRAVGENHAAAHALGYPVRRIRLLAILFGGGCAGLAGAYMSLVLTPFWSSGMTAGRGWIALAIVVFASWLPFRAMVGAYLFGALTILQLHAQSAGVPLPSQFLAALPYLITILVLVLIMRARRGGAAGPASLGVPFVPDR